MLLVSSVIGGLLALSLAPHIYGYGNLSTPAPLPGSDQKDPLSPAYLDYSPVVKIAEQVGPAVIGISNQAVGRSLFNRELIEQGSGSGVIISQDGYIVTNYHVIQNAERLVVTLANDKQLEAEVRGSDPDTDLAVLRIKASNLPVAVLGDSSQLRVGELVVAIGNPLGAEFARSVTAGVVSAKERHINIQERKVTLIQTDAAINPGNSGGALVNSSGQVIGINSAKLVIPGVEGMGFAIPINDAKPIINELIERGYVSRPALGIWGVAIDELLARQNNLPPGIYIRELVRSGPAQQAGLKTGDIILSINGQRVTSFDEMSKALEKFKPGDKVTVDFYRGGKKYSAELVLGERGRQ
jgi:serine protease Do